jgi:hypothetical protein
MTALFEGFRVYSGDLPRQLDGDLLSLGRQLVCSRSQPRLIHEKVKSMRTSTIGPIFKGLYLDTCPAICVGVFGVFPYLLP